jgi:hypothetical protein
LLRQDEYEEILDMRGVQDFVSTLHPVVREQDLDIQSIKRFSNTDRYSLDVEFNLKSKRFVTTDPSKPTFTFPTDAFYYRKLGHLSR